MSTVTNYLRIVLKEIDRVNIIEEILKHPEELELITWNII